jgi:hypothetical protein
MLELERHPEVLWPTTTLSVVVKNSDELNSQLAQVILTNEYTTRLKMRDKPNALPAGYVSNLLKWKEPSVAEFRDVLLDSVRRYIGMVGDTTSPEMKIAGIGCWANVLRSGEGLGIHHHDPGFISGHYQVRSGNVAGDGAAGESGHTVYFRPGFLDRCHGVDAAVTASNLWDRDWRLAIPAQEGRMFLFPSYVRHEVRPYIGLSERISIAFDIFVQKQRSLINFNGSRYFVPA